MNLSLKTYQELKSMAQELKNWLVLYKKSKKFVAANPKRIAQKEAIEDALHFILSLLKAENKGTTIVNKKLTDAIHLEWWSTDNWQTTLSPFIIKFWTDLPAKNFDKTKIEAKAYFSFGTKEVAANLVVAHEWENNDYKCLGYDCKAIWPEDFLSGAVDLTINLAYDNNSEQSSLTKTFLIEGISTEGQSVIDFLTAINIDTQLRDDAWSYANDEEKQDANLKTLDQLVPIQYKLDLLVKGISQLQESYQSFAHKDLLYRLIKGDPSVGDELFRGHKKVVLTEGGIIKTSLDYLSNWKLPNNLKKTFLSPLSNNLKIINEKIALIHKEQELAEQNYAVAKTELGLKSPIAALLLSHIYSIVTIDKTFQTLKANYPEIVPPDGTDAFRLVVKEKEFLENMQEKLNNINTAYKEASSAFLDTYKELYKGNGALKDKILTTEATNFNKAAKKAKQDIPPKLELRVFGKMKGVKLHAFLFNSIEALLEQADNFFYTFHIVFERIRKDFSVIDTSTLENSIRAYNPESDDITNKYTQQNSIKNPIVTTCKHENLDNKLVNEEGINPEDVDQGALADCYFLATVASLAQFSPKAIYGGEDAIIQGPNDKGKYTVKLFVPNHPNGIKRVSTEIDPSFLTKTVVNKNDIKLNNSSKTTMLAQPSKQSEIWPQLLEKALAQLEGSYSEVTGENKQISLNPIEMLIGKKATYYEVNKGIDAPINALVELYNATNKIPMAQFGTKKNLKPTKDETESQKDAPKPASGETYILYKDRIRLYADHLYYLKGISSSTKGGESFVLENPHNDKNEGLDKNGGTKITIDRNDLESYFENIIITP